MKNLETIFKKIALKVPEIYLPEKKEWMQDWAVVACDQYTSDTSYWEEVEEKVSKKPSTLHLIYPECYLGESHPEERIMQINRTMEKYLNDGTLIKNEPSFLLVERKTASGLVRHGIIAALDLEAYNYSKGSTSLIRATEGTIESRIPPRKKIREKAPLELPHIIVLIDDPGKTVIEPLLPNKKAFEVMYDFDLMKNGGHVKGFKVNDSKSISSIVSSLEKLADPAQFKEKYRTDDVLLYAMGDGNHSLATAKSVWEDIKSKLSTDPDRMNHPSRWALVEIENIHDNGIIFEPIHRVLFNCRSDLFFKILKESGKFHFEKKNTLNEVISSLRDQSSSQKIGYCDQVDSGVIEIINTDSSIAAGSIEKIVETLLKLDPEISVDYIHGDEETYNLGKKDNNIGIFLPAISKDTFFRTIVKDKTFPRKTFSMGEANEKRYYVESRKIIP